MHILLFTLCSIILLLTSCNVLSPQKQQGAASEHILTSGSTPTSENQSTSNTQTIIPLDHEVAKRLINDQRVGETRFFIPTQAIRTKTNGAFEWNLTDDTITQTNTESSTQRTGLLVIESPVLLGTQMIGHSLIHTTDTTAWISMKDGLGTRTLYLIARTDETTSITISKPGCIPLFILLDTSIICSQLNTKGKTMYTTLIHRKPDSQRIIYPTNITSLHTNGTHLLWTHNVGSQTELLIYDTQNGELLGSTRLSGSIGAYHPFIIRDHRVYRGNADQGPSPQSEHKFSSFMRRDLRTNEIITFE